MLSNKQFKKIIRTLSSYKDYQFDKCRVIGGPKKFVLLKPSKKLIYNDYDYDYNYWDDSPTVDILYSDKFYLVFNDINDFSIVNSEIICAELIKVCYDGALTLTNEKAFRMGKGQLEQLKNMLKKIQPILNLGAI